MSLQVGRFRIDWLDGGLLHLDAGAMFGVVPKPLWQGRYPVDDRNRMPLEASPLLIRSDDDGEALLVDTGLGTRYSEKQKRNFHMTRPFDLDGSLRRLGLTPQTIRHVLLTHMDFDHAGGGIVEDKGCLSPRFQHARYWVHRVEWHDFLHPNRRSSNTYRLENGRPLQDAGLLHLVEGRQLVTHGLEIIHTGGHTRGHQIILIQSEEQTALHLGDLLPTHAHLNPLWVTAYDNDPVQSVAQKEYWLDFARRRSAWLLFYHDAVYCAVRLNQEGEITDRLPRPVSP